MTMVKPRPMIDFISPVIVGVSAFFGSESYQNFICQCVLECIQTSKWSTFFLLSQCSFTVTSTYAFPENGDT